jgi:photosystem II stability/assembly factor-like uncharacterized protein
MIIKEYSNQNKLSAAWFAVVFLIANFVCLPFANAGDSDLKKENSSIAFSKCEMLNPPPAGNITLIYPNATGITMYFGSTVFFEWSGTLPTSFVDVHYSINNGASWIQLDTGIFNNFFYQWQVPSIPTTTARVRVRDHTDNSVLAISQYNFTLAPIPPSVSLLTPNGGENWEIAFPKNISWTSTNVANVDLDYSINGGTNWLPIAAGVSAALGSYTWTIPNNPSGTCKVRIKDSGSSAQDVSNANFNIFMPVPFLGLYSPIGFEEWAINSSHLIGWVQQYVDTINIEYSLNGGNTWNTVANNVPTSIGNYLWNLPSSTSNNCFVRIYEAGNPSIADTTDVAFSITNPSFVLLTPDGGEQIIAGFPYNISWNGNLSNNFVDIAYSTNNGQSWNPVANNIFNLNSYPWILPNTPSNQCLVRVSDSATTAVSDVSNAVFEILPPVPFIDLFEPFGGTIVSLNSLQNISYVTYNVNAVNIDLSTDNGNTWTNIVNNHPAANGYYQWFVQGDTSSFCKIRITDAATPSYFVSSDTVFVIDAPPPSIILNYPFGGETLAQGTVQMLTWVPTNILNVKLEFSADNGATWSLIAVSLPAINLSYAWTVPFVFSNQCLVRISDAANGTVNDISGLFNVSGPYLNLIVPDGGESYIGISTMLISWNSSGISGNLDIDISYDGGTTWNGLVTNIPNTGYYLANVPQNATTTAKLKLKAVQSGLLIVDESVGNFSINLPGPIVRVLAPNGGNYFGAGSSMDITWLSYQVNYVRIELSTDGGITYNLVNPFFPSSLGLYTYVIPVGIASPNCRVKVMNAADFTVSDNSDNNFTIGASNLQLLSPNTGVLTAGSNLQVQWQSTGIGNYVKIEFNDGTSSAWQTLANSALNDGSFTHTLPLTNLTSAKYRVSDFYNPLVFAESSPGFDVLLSNPNLLVNYPNGGELFGTGDSILVQWAPSSVPSIDVLISIDNGINWTLVLSGVPGSQGNAFIALPTTPSISAKIRISNTSNPQQFDDSDLSFQISDPYLLLTSFTGGGSYFTNSNQIITWAGVGVDYVDLYYSANSGTSWNLIDTSVVNSGNYLWMLPNTAGTNYRLRLIGRNILAAADTSVSDFSIVSNPQLTLTSFNQGSFVGGTTQNITWQAQSVAGNVKIDLKIGNGAWQTISNVASIGSGYYAWNLPNQNIPQAKIRISSFANNSLQDSSSATFAIAVPVNNMNLIFPAQDDTLLAGSNLNILFAPVNVPYVSLYFSEDNFNWFFLGTAAGNAGYYNWTVPSIQSNFARIKVEEFGNPLNFSSGLGVFNVVTNTSSNTTISLNSTQTSYPVCKGTPFTLPVTISGSYQPYAQAFIDVTPSGTSFNNATTISIPTSVFNGNTVAALVPFSLNSGTYDLRFRLNNPTITSVVYPDLIVVSGTEFQLLLSGNDIFLPGASVIANILPASSVFSVNWEINGITQAATTAGFTLSTNAPGMFEVNAEVTDNNNCISQMPAQWVHAGWLLPVEEPLYANAGRDLLAIDYANSLIGSIAASDGSILLTVDGGLTWQEANSGLLPPRPVADLTHHLNKFYACSQNGVILSSSDNGLTWQRVQLNTGESFSAISFSPAGLGYVCGTNGIIRKYNGTIWQSAPSGTAEHLNDIVTLGTGFLAVGNNGTVRLFANNTLDTINAGTNLNLNALNMLNADTGFICGDNGLVLKTIDGGIQWNAILSGSDANLKSIAVSGDTLWAVGTKGRVIISTDAGNSWLERKVSPKEDINELAYNASLNKVFLVGNNNLLRMFGNPDPVSDTVSSLAMQPTPLSFTLYPNPATDYVVITGMKDQSQFSTFSWFDQRGVKISSQNLSGMNSQGTLQLNVKSFSSGFYFLRLQGAEQAITFKVVIKR